MIFNGVRQYSVLMISFATVGVPIVASGQENRGTGLEEIIVTARKREETSISVPVVITAVSGAELERRGVNSIDGLARLVPQLVVGEGGGTVQGGNIALRGISGADANPFGDQAVAFNFDGVQVARASVRRMAEMDIQQVEVLKGPQALYYGKNSPGGIISIRTADPTDELKAQISTGYEFNAEEWRAEGFVAGPITDTLGFRLAAYGSMMSGWVDNTVPRASPLAPGDDSVPDNDEYAVRATLKYAPSDQFDARLKVTYGKLDGDASAANVQFVDCPVNGTPQSGGVDNCKADDQVSMGELGPVMGSVYPTMGSGKTFLEQKQTLVGLEMNYHLNDSLTVTSVTGYYDVSLDNIANFTASYIAPTILGSHNRMDITERSQELRLTSDFDAPLNFMFGAYYQSSDAETGSVTFLNANTAVRINNYLLEQEGEAWSVFGELTYDITETIELSGGGRYSDETKKLPSVRSQAGSAGPFIYPPPRVQTVKSEESWYNFSPEATLSWRPNTNFTVFGSYKEGFLSGGFNSGSANFALPLDYDEQTVEGFEVGLKALLLDESLRINFAAYDYDVKGLQVQVTTQGTIQELKNAGKVRTRGAEFDFNYLTTMSGLTLHGALAYSHGRYDTYFGNCYRGQTKAAGCAYVPVPNSPGDAIPAAAGQAGTLQDLGDTDLIRSPEWTGNVGLTYERPLTATLKLGFSADATYSDDYLTDASSKEAGRSPSYTLYDASVRLADANDRWEVAFIGRNLGDEHYWTRNSDVPFSGTAPGNEVGPAVLGDSVASISRGREYMLKLTARY
ncbi:MAG: TonB-dependent receptor [Steroidobacteraceae bacterium]